MGEDLGDFSGIDATGASIAQKLAGVPKDEDLYIPNPLEPTRPGAPKLVSGEAGQQNLVQVLNEQRARHESKSTLPPLPQPPPGYESAQTPPPMPNEPPPLINRVPNYESRVPNQTFAPLPAPTYEGANALPAINLSGEVVVPPLPPNIESPIQTERTPREQLMDEIYTQRMVLQNRLAAATPSTLLPESVRSTILKEKQGALDLLRVTLEESQVWDNFIQNQEEIEQTARKLHNNAEIVQRETNGTLSNELTPNGKRKLNENLNTQTNNFEQYVITNIPEIMWADYGVSSETIANHGNHLRARMVQRQETNTPPQDTVQDFLEHQEKWRQQVLTEKNKTPRERELEKQLAETQAAKKALEETVTQLTEEKERLQKELDAAKQLQEQEHNERVAAEQREAATREELNTLRMWHQQILTPLTPEQEAQMPDELRPIYAQLRENERLRQENANLQQRIDQPENPIAPVTPEPEVEILPPETPRSWRDFLNKFDVSSFAIGVGVTQAAAVGFLAMMPELGQWAYETGSIAATFAFACAEISTRFGRFRESHPNMARFIQRATVGSIFTSVANTALVVGYDIGTSNLFATQPTISPETVIKEVEKVAQAVPPVTSEGTKNLLNGIPPGNFGWPDHLTVQGAGDSIWTTVGNEISQHLPAQLELSAGGQLYLTDAVKDIVISQYPDPQHVVHIGDVLNFSPDVQREIGHKILTSLEQNTKNPDTLKLINEVDVVHLRQIGNLLINVK